MRHAVHRHVPLLHRLEQRRLGLRRRAVDLVAQHDVAEDRPGPEGESPLRREQVHPGDVRRHQIGRELNAAKLEAENEAERAHEQGLRRPGNSLEEHVAAGDQGGDRVSQGRLLSQHHTPELVQDRLPRISALTSASALATASPRRWPPAAPRRHSAGGW